MSDIKLEDILTRLKSEDRTVLKEIFQLHYPMVAKSIHRFIQDSNLVKDLAQEVFVRLWNKRYQIQITSSLEAYLRRMAINEALGYLRSQKNHVYDEFTLDSVQESSASSEEKFLFGELENHISQAIDTLPPKCKIIFQMSRFDEMTYKEIADNLQISIKTVENQMGKALKLLREQLQDYL